MNIPVLTAGGHVIVRPDTTWDKNSRDVFLPEFVDRVSWSPVLFARISKPGRSIAMRFANRYYDGIGYGVLLYPENLVDGSEEGYASASCIDHTSFLPMPVYNKITLGNEDNEFVLLKDGDEIFSYSAATAAMVCKALEDASRSCYLRTGDLVAIELQPRGPLLARADGECRVEGTFCDNRLLDFRVIL